MATENFFFFKFKPVFIFVDCNNWERFKKPWQCKTNYYVEKQKNSQSVKACFTSTNTITGDTAVEERAIGIL